MTLRAYLTLMIITTLICWSAFSFVLWTVDPESTDWIGLVLFYISLFLALTGSAAIIGFIIRFKALKRELAFRAVKTAFRQSFIFAFLIIATLFLLSMGLFTWLNLVLLVLGLSVIEFIIISMQKS